MGVRAVALLLLLVVVGAVVVIVARREVRRDDYPLSGVRRMSRRILSLDQAVALATKGGRRDARSSTRTRGPRTHRVRHPSTGWHLRRAFSWPCTTWTTDYACLMLTGPDVFEDEYTWGPLDCRFTGSLSVTFNHYFAARPGGNFEALLRISTDDGRSYRTIRRYREEVSGTERIDITRWAKDQARVRLQWYSLGRGDCLKAWALDNVDLHRSPVPAYDVGIAGILVPPQRCPTHLNIVPRVCLVNYGCVPESATVELRIPGYYRRVSGRVAIGLRERRDVSFEAWQPPPGIKCTMYACVSAKLDQNPGNDTFRSEITTFQADWSSHEPQFSPDGSHVLFWREDSAGWHQICVMPAAGDGEEVLATEDYKLESPCWSPDGRSVAYCHLNQIYSQPSAGGHARCLAKLLSTDPHWSPDGKTVAYVSLLDENHIGIVSSDGASERDLAGGADCFSPRWSPDGNWIAYIRLVQNWLQIWKADVRTGESEPLTQERCHHVFPAWSHDGQWLVYEQQDSQGFTQIHRISNTGQSEITLTSGESNHEYPTFSPDDQWVLLTRSDGRTTQVCRVSVRGGALHAVTREQTIKRYPEWSPNGQLIAFEEQSLPSAIAEPCRIRIIESGIGETAKLPTPGETAPESRLDAPVPNPAVNQVTIGYTLSEPGSVLLGIYDLSGRRVRLLTSAQKRPPGRNQVVWNRLDDHHQRVPNGVYICRLITDRASYGQKLILE